MGQHRKTRKKRTIPPHILVPEESEFRLPPEDDLGNVEYKSQLIKPTASRIQHLITQMTWRLKEGDGEAIYELGVNDDGSMMGLDASELAETMTTMYEMTRSIGASLFILNDRCVFGKPEDASCRRVVEVLIKLLPSEQSFADMRIALLGSAGCGKSTLCGVLTQGTLDNGNGKTRLNLLRYLHEIRSGKTSAVTMDCFGFSKDGNMLNYKEGDLKNILEQATKLVTLIDLAGDHRFLKTTIYGLSGYSPHYCALLVNSRIGWTDMAEEHLTIANAFNIPLFIMITKIDLIKQKDERVQKILAQIQAAIDRSQKRLHIKHITCEEESIYTAHSIGNIMPVFSISNVTGENHNLLTKFLHLLPNRNLKSAGSDNDARPLFYIDEVFNFSESGPILCGLMANGVLNEADEVQIGPDSAGNYRLAKIKTLRRNKQPVLKLRRNEIASIGIEFVSDNKTDFNIRKGMVVVEHDFGNTCRKFKANFKLISHSPGDEICVGFKGTAYIGSLRRAVTIIDFDSTSIRLGEWIEVTFEFFGGPEFVRIGSTLFFRERGTKGVGEITEIPDS